MAEESHSPSNTSFDESNPFSSNDSTSQQSSNSPNGTSCAIIKESKTESPTPFINGPNSNKRRSLHRRASSVSKSYQDLESLEFTHLQDQCKSGANYTSSIIRLLGKLCDGYDKFGKSLTQTVEQETNFINKYTTQFFSDSSFALSYELLCEFTKDLAINFQQIGMEIKTKMIEPLIEFQKECDNKYHTIYKKHEHSYNKYISDQNNLNSYNDKYKAIGNEEDNKFKLIRLLSSGIMPPNDHKILKKSWHSPSKFNQSVSKFIEKARTKTRKVSINLGNKRDNNHNSHHNMLSSDNEEKEDKGNGDEIEDIYEWHTKDEIDRNNEDKRDHIPLLYAMYKYSNTRNKLIKYEDLFVQNIENVNHSMTQYEYIRKETMKSMKKMEIERFTQSKDIYDNICKIYGMDEYQVIKKDSFNKFKESISMLKADIEFNNFLRKSQIIKEYKYNKPHKLISNEMLISWRTPYHLFEDLMFKQINEKHINKNSLRVPYIFEYLMEHIQSESAINDPDIFMLNAISPKQSNIDHSFAFRRRLSPQYDKSIINDDNTLMNMKTSDLQAIPVLTNQINELYECNNINISDHHHAIILLKLWLYKSPEPLIPYYLYDRVCLFQFQNTVKQRQEFVEDEIFNKLSDVRICCLARLVNICKLIVKKQNQITIIDLSYELSNVIIRNPKIDQWRHLDPINNNDDNIDDINKLKKMLDPQSTYKLPLSPSHKIKRAEMAFITYILSNHVPILNQKKIVNYGSKLNSKKN